MKRRGGSRQLPGLMLVLLLASKWGCIRRSHLYTSVLRPNRIDMLQCCVMENVNCRSYMSDMLRVLPKRCGGHGRVLGVTSPDTDVHLTQMYVHPYQPSKNLRWRGEICIPPWLNLCGTEGEELSLELEASIHPSLATPYLSTLFQSDPPTCYSTI